MITRSQEINLYDLEYGWCILHLMCKSCLVKEESFIQKKELVTLHVDVYKKMHHRRWFVWGLVFFFLNCTLICRNSVIAVLTLKGVVTVSSGLVHAAYCFAPKEVILCIEYKVGL